MSPPIATETVTESPYVSDHASKTTTMPATKSKTADKLLGYPTLKPAYILKVNVATGSPVGELSTGSKLIHWDTPTGTFSTADGYEHKIEADVIYGSDWLSFDPDNKHARPNLKLLCKTKDGVIIDMAYSGIAKLSQPIFEMFEGNPNAKTMAFGSSTTTHTFQTGHAAYKHLETGSFVGNGRFVVKQNPFSITVESRISQVVPSTDYDYEGE